MQTRFIRSGMRKPSYDSSFIDLAKVCEKCPNAEIFLFVVSCIRTEYGDLRRKSPYSVQIQENTDQKKTPYLDTFHAVLGVFISLQQFINFLEKSVFNTI